jgi:hypothetical protein
MDLLRKILVNVTEEPINETTHAIFYRGLVLYASAKLPSVPENSIQITPITRQLISMVLDKDAGWNVYSGGHAPTGYYDAVIYSTSYGVVTTSEIVDNVDQSIIDNNVALYRPHREIPAASEDSAMHSLYKAMADDISDPFSWKDIKTMTSAEDEDMEPVGEKITRLKKELAELEAVVPVYPFKDGDNYWALNALGSVMQCQWLGENYNIGCYEMGNTYNSKTEAIEARDKQKALVRVNRRIDELNDSTKKPMHHIYRAVDGALGSVSDAFDNTGAVNHIFHPGTREVIKQVVRELGDEIELIMTGEESK